MLCSDLDVVWLGDPRPWTEGWRNDSLLLALADVIVSTDVTGDLLENDKAVRVPSPHAYAYSWRSNNPPSPDFLVGPAVSGPMCRTQSATGSTPCSTGRCIHPPSCYSLPTQQAWGVHNEMNTGIIFLRSTASSFLLLEAWLARMRKELEKVATMSATYVQWWTNDQTYFNEVVHHARTLSMNPKARAPADRAAWMEHMLAHSADEKKKALVGRVVGEIVEEYGGRGSGWLDTLRGVVCKELTCTDAKCPATKLPLTIATFPYLQFASGHTYFTQSVQDRLGFIPVSVHTTFQFGDTPEFTWGKRNRLRERQLWVVDSDSYYTRQGPGLHPKEIEYDGFLQLVGPLVNDGLPYVLTESSASIKIEGHGAFSEAMRSNRVNILTLDDGNPNKHLLLDSMQRRLVINLVALGRALKRKVIMPKMMCWCDRYWWLLEGCRFPGVKPEVHPMPFHCPFDHLYDLEKWVHSDVPMREYSFLENKRVNERDRQDVVHLHVHGAPVEASPPTGTTVMLHPGDDYAAAARALNTAGKQSAFVVKVHARSLELLCESLGSAGANKKFNGIMHTVLGVAEQV